jgi:alpha-tubulin suppressor-like RCC1 family protein
LGHGDDAYRRLPTLIEGLQGKVVVKATCVGAHNAVLTSEGQVFMWGSGTVSDTYPS